MHKILFNLKLSMNIYSSLHHALAHSYFWLIKRHAGRGIRLLRPPQPSARPILWSLRLIQSSPLGFVARHMGQVRHVAACSVGWWLMAGAGLF
jgi:hypothetical protein